MCWCDRSLVRGIGQSFIKKKGYAYEQVKGPFDMSIMTSTLKEAQNLCM